MLWFFEREADSLRLETRYDNDNSEFVAIIHRPEGSRRIERFTDIVAFQRRLVALEQQLEKERWARKGPPVILPDGWPHRRLVNRVVKKKKKKKARGR
jgi:hypothetical protein